MVWQSGTKRAILVFSRCQQMPLLRQLWFLLILALGLIGNSSGRASAGNQEAVFELQINKFSAFINVKGDYRQKMLETFLFIVQGISLLPALLLSWSNSSRSSPSFEGPASKCQVVASFFEIAPLLFGYVTELPLMRVPINTMPFQWSWGAKLRWNDYP